MLAPLFIVAALFAPPPDDSEGKRLLQRVCGQCHKLDIVTSRRLTREGWQQTIQAMVDKGAEGTEEEFNAILEYLTKYYGPASDKPKGGAAPKK